MKRCHVGISLIALLTLFGSPKIVSAQQAADSCEDLGKLTAAGICHCPARTTTGNIHDRYKCNQSGCNGCSAVAAQSYREDRDALRAKCKADCAAKKDSNNKPCRDEWKGEAGAPSRPSCMPPDDDGWKMEHDFTCNCLETSPQPEALPSQ